MEKGETMYTVMDAVKEFDTAIESYTEDRTSMARQRVVDPKTGREGIVISKKIKDPKTDKDSILVQWLTVGGQTYFPANAFEKANPDLYKLETNFDDYLMHTISQFG